MPDSLIREVADLSAGVRAAKEDLGEVRSDVRELFKVLNEGNIRTEKYQSQTVEVLKQINDNLADHGPRIDDLEKAKSEDRTIVKTALGIFASIGTLLLGIIVFGDNLWKMIKGSP